MRVLVGAAHDSDGSGMQLPSASSSKQLVQHLHGAWGAIGALADLAREPDEVARLGDVVPRGKLVERTPERGARAARRCHDPGRQRARA